MVNQIEITFKSGYYYTMEPLDDRCQKPSSPPVKHYARPTEDEVKTAFETELSNAIGEFVKSMLDDGFTVNVLEYNTNVSYEMKYQYSFYCPELGQVVDVDLRRTVIVLKINFNCNPSIWGSPVDPATWVAIGKMAALIILALGAGGGLYYFFKDFGKTETIIREYEDGELVREEIQRGIDWKFIAGVVALLVLVVFVIVYFGGKLGVSKKGLSLGRK